MSIVDFTCLRIQDELHEYAKHHRIPYGLVEGVYTVSDIADCMATFPPDIQCTAKRLISHYTRATKENKQDLLYRIKLEYIHIINHMQTRSSDFKFPTVLALYRSDINPIKALYYEIREVVLHYNQDNEIHVWLISLIQNVEFYNKLIDAIDNDISKLDYFITKYHPLAEPIGIPLELVHARQLVKEFAECKKLFKSVYSWDAE